MRAGMVIAVCDDSINNVQWVDYSTADLGDTRNLTFNVANVSSKLTLRATAASGTWSVSAVVRKIGV